MAPESLLRVHDLGVQFGNRTVLDGVEFEVNQNEILGIMGASGGGKSTILKSIIGLARPTRGQIYFAGQDLTQLSELDLSKIRPSIGFVFQNGALFDSLSVFENLRYPLLRHSSLTDEQMTERITERLRMVGLEGSADMSLSDLSGGMQKRVGLIRATILNQKLVLYDEPTAGLDPINIQHFIDKVQKIKQQGRNGGVFISHDFAVVRSVCDRVALLWEGRLRVVATPAELQNSEDPVVRSLIRPPYQEALCG